MECLRLRQGVKDAQLANGVHCSWDEFKAMVDEREPKMLRAFTSMEVNPAGGLEQKSIKGEPWHHFPML